MKKKFVDTPLVESVLGTRTTEDMARRIEEKMKSVSSENRKPLYKSAIDTKPEVNDKERSDVSVITTNTPDRDNEIVDPIGLDVSDYLLNPVVLFGHDDTQIAGRCLWIQPTADGSGLLGKTQYPSRPKSLVGEWLPDYVYGLVQAECLKGKSIGFLPLEERPPNDEEIALYPNLERVISKSYLLEFSCVAIPCNPVALVAAVTKGLTTLDRWGYNVVKQIKPKAKILVEKVVAETVKEVLKPKKVKQKAFTVEEISEAVIKEIARRWEV